MAWQVPWLPRQLPPVVDMQWLAPDETTLDETELTSEERRYQTFLEKIMHSNQEFIPVGKSCETDYEDEDDEEEDEEGEEEEDESNEEEDEGEADAEPNDVLMEEEPPEANVSLNTLS